MGTTAKRIRFLDGIECFHGDEIALATRIYSALILTMGGSSARDLARTNPAKLFRPLCYGRRLHVMRGMRPSVSTLVDVRTVRGNKPANAFILTPDREEWGDVCQRIAHNQARPNYATDRDGNPLGFHAAAEALSALGFAVAESLAVAMLFGAENDDDFGNV
jgi:hypothetical protein